MKEIPAAHSLKEALAEAATCKSVRIRLEERTYREKLCTDHPCLWLEGRGREASSIQWQDAATDVWEDGNTCGTFRSYTAFFGGRQLVLKDLTIANGAGRQPNRKQCIAAYLGSERVYAESCAFVSGQDTLFLAPLPAAARIPGSFRGPGEHAPRILTKQYFYRCRIVGDVDFIFGGADAVFEECEIVCLDREHDGRMGTEKGDENGINGYVAAPSGSAQDLGMVFLRCSIRGEDGIRPASVFLARPWRPQGKAVFLHCTTDACISPQRFSGWEEAAAFEEEAFFGEYATRDTHGHPLMPSEVPPWVHRLDEAEAGALLRRAEDLKRTVLPSTSSPDRGIIKK